MSNPKPDVHNIIAYTKFGKNPLTFIQVIVWVDKMETGGCMTDGRVNRHMDDQYDTIISSHYGMVGYKKCHPKLQGVIFQSKSIKISCFLYVASLTGDISTYLSGYP